MRFKLDENLGRAAAAVLTDAGHDVSTVVEQGLASSSDRRLWEACGSEQRALVTLDLDFADPFHFVPTDSAGVAVLRLPRRPGAGDIRAVLATLVTALESHSIAGELWIVQGTGVRRYVPGVETD